MTRYCGVSCVGMCDVAPKVLCDWMRAIKAWKGSWLCLSGVEVEEGEYKEIITVC